MAAAPFAQVHDTYISTHRPYDTKRFVDRDRELGCVRDQVQHIRDHVITREPLINYWGVKGIGKTWVLRHVRYLFAYSGESLYGRPTFTALYSAQPDLENSLAIANSHRLLKVAK